MDSPASQRRPFWRSAADALSRPAALVVLLLCAAYSVDSAYLCARSVEQQNSADAAALAGASALQESDPTSVLQRARLVLHRNQRIQGFSALDDQSVEVGLWDSVNREFTPLSMSEWRNRAFAVRVRATRDKIPLFFARLMGKATATVQREAVSIGNGPCRGIWGLRGISVDGDVKVDGYDSTRGDYVSGAYGQGDLCSGRGIDAQAEFDVRGRVMTGLGYSVNVGGEAQIPSGITTATLSGVDTLDLDLEKVQMLPNNGALTLSGRQTLALGHPLALFESIVLRDRSSVRVDHPTTIYVLGELDTQGAGFVNTTRDPANLTIVALGERVSIHTEEEFFGAIIAPQAHVELSGTHDFFGTVIGRSVEVKGDMVFHIDTSLPAHDLIKPPMPVLVK